MKRWVMVLGVLLLPRVALAGDPAGPLVLTPVPPGEDRIVLQEGGKPAPFSGQLFDDATALRWSNYLQQCQTRARIEGEYSRRVQEAALAFEQKRLQLSEEQNHRVIVDLQDRLRTAEQQLQSPPWYRTVPFGIVVGVLGTIGIVAGSAALVGAVK